MTPALELTDVHAGYGRIEVLARRQPRRCRPGSVVALLGPNGVGKTTTLRAIAGSLRRARRGRSGCEGRRIDNRRASAIAPRGLVLVPEGRGVFPALTVLDNLQVAHHSAPAELAGPWTEWLDEIADTFPRLGDRLGQQAGSLSGGEQQMLAVCRAMVGDPKVVLFDELSMGLAPLVVAELFDHIARFREQGRTVLLVEQYLTYALELADLCYVLAKGQVAWQGDPSRAQVQPLRISLLERVVAIASSGRGASRGEGSSEAPHGWGVAGGAPGSTPRRGAGAGGWSEPPRRSDRAAVVSRSMAARTRSAWPCARSRLVSATASGSRRASVSAAIWVSRCRSSSGTTFQASPIDAAEGASTHSLDSSIHAASGRRTRPGRSTELAASGVMPREVNGVRRRADAATMTRSQCSRRVHPKPTARPFTAARTGIEQRPRVSSSPTNASPAASSFPELAEPSMSDRSAPAEKGAADAGEDDASRLVGRRPAQRQLQILVVRGRERVQALRSIEGEPEHTRSDLHPQHRRSLAPEPTEQTDRPQVPRA